MGNVVKLIRRGARSGGAANVSADAIRRALAAAAVVPSPTDALRDAERRFMADSRARVRVLMADLEMQHDRLDRLIDVLPDEHARARLRRSLDVLREQIELVRSFAKSI